MPYLEELKRTGLSGAVSIELEYSREPAKIADWVRDAYRATDCMMQTLGTREAAPSPMSTR